MKICTKCKIDKPFESFYKNKNSPDGLRHACIECEKLRKLELKNNPLMQLEKEIRSSVILENKLLKRENKKLCKSCKEVFLIDDLWGGVVCNECSNKNVRDYYKKNKEKKREKNRAYRLKKKLERIKNE